MKPAKLIFSRGAPEQIPYFFTASLSGGGSKLTILDAHPQILEGLGQNLRTVFQRQIQVDRTTESGLYTIHLARGTNS